MRRGGWGGGRGPLKRGAPGGLTGVVGYMVQGGGRGVLRMEDAVMTGQREHAGSGGGGTGTVERTRPARPRVDRLPPWKVLLHNDDVNFMEDVIGAIVELTVLGRQDAILRMLEAHKSGIALLLTTHREHAELLQEQFASKRLTVTIEPEG